MTLNKEALRRYSTYANMISMMVSAALLGLPDIGFEPIMVARIMLAGNVVVALCQAVKQQAN